MARSNFKALISASLVLGWLLGCASTTEQDEQDVNTGLSHLAEEGESTGAQPDGQAADAGLDIEDYAAHVGMNLDQLLNQTQPPPQDPIDRGTQEGWLASLSTDPGTALWLNTQRTFATMRQQIVQPTWQAMLTEHERRSSSPEQQIAMHVEQIAAIIRSQSDAQDMDIGRLMALSAMEAVRPGMLHESVDPIELELLRPEVRSTLEAVRTVVASHAHPISEADPIDVSEQFLAAADQVWEATPMNIKLATLARRVVGYGRYEPFTTSSFVAGRPQRMIVYTEIDNFSHRRFRDADLRSSSESSLGAAWTVEVSQELHLFRDGTYIWGKPEQTIIETSRNKRRDFYLVHQIELPPTLTVGPYELKIIMRDKTSGEVDEAIIPFSYVADYAAVGVE